MIQRDPAEHFARGKIPDEWVDAAEATLVSGVALPPRNAPNETAARATQFATLRQLLEHPEMLEPPECIVPRLAWRGHVTMLAAGDKGGKTTLAAHAARAVTTGGYFLGEPTSPRTGWVLWVGLEESISHAVRRFHELGADPERVTMVTLGSSDLLDAVREQLRAGSFDFVLIDSLQEYARVSTGDAPGDGDNGAWGAIVRPLVAMARQFDVAMLLLHHVRRSDSKARGAGEILAAVDVLIEMESPPGGDPRVRRLSGRGRWAVPKFEVILEADGYRLNGGPEPTLEVQVLEFVRQNGPCSRQKVKDSVRKRATNVVSAIDSLISSGALIEGQRGLSPGGRGPMKPLCKRSREHSGPVPRATRGYPFPCTRSHPFRPHSATMKAGDAAIPFPTPNPNERVWDEGRMTSAAGSRVLVCTRGRELPDNSVSLLERLQVVGRHDPRCPVGRNRGKK